MTRHELYASPGAAFSLQVWTFEAQDAVFTFTPTQAPGPKPPGPKPAAQEIVVDGKLKIVSVDLKLMNGA